MEEDLDAKVLLAQVRQDALTGAMEYDQLGQQEGSQGAGAESWADQHL